jgi:hypothetical protein
MTVAVDYLTSGIFQGCHRIEIHLTSPSATSIARHYVRVSSKEELDREVDAFVAQSEYYFEQGA